MAQRSASFGANYYRNHRQEQCQCPAKKQPCAKVCYSQIPLPTECLDACGDCFKKVLHGVEFAEETSQAHLKAIAEQYQVGWIGAKEALNRAMHCFENKALLFGPVKTAWENYRTVLTKGENAKMGPDAIEVLAGADDVTDGPPPIALNDVLVVGITNSLISLRETLNGLVRKIASQHLNTLWDEVLCAEEFVCDCAKNFKKGVRRYRQAGLYIYQRRIEDKLRDVNRSVRCAKGILTKMSNRQFKQTSLDFAWTALLRVNNDVARGLEWNDCLKVVIPTSIDACAGHAGDDCHNNDVCLDHNHGGTTAPACPAFC